MSVPMHIREAAVADYVAGKSIDAAAADNGVSRNSLQRWLRAAHVPRRRPGPVPKPRTEAPKKRRRHYDPEPIAYMGQWVRDGLILRPATREKQQS